MYQSTPITIGPTNILPIDPMPFQSHTKCIKIDRLKYSIRIRHSFTFPILFGQGSTHRRKTIRSANSSRQIRINQYIFHGCKLQVIHHEQNHFWFQIIMDDPTDFAEKALWKILDQLPANHAKLSEVEIALDFSPDQPENLDILKRQILNHLWLPRARRGARPHDQEGIGIEATWYLGSQRGGARNVKVYEKRLGESAESSVIRVEWTIHGRFEAYGINPRAATCLDGLKMEKLLQWRKADYRRMADLAYQRITGRPMHFHRRRDPWIGLAVTQLRSIIRSELNPDATADHLEVLGQMLERYMQLDWTRAQDIAKVFRRLGHGPELQSGTKCTE